MYNSHLETFIEVADAGSFSKAAQNLFITPTAVIKQINLLEADNNLQLFDRSHRGVILTEAGKTFYKDAKYIIRYSKESIERAKRAMDIGKSTIRIGTSLMTPCQFLIDLWPKIEALCPDVKLELVSFENTPENAREILANLGQNIDVVAGIFDSSFQRQRGCHTLELFKTPVCCAVSINHPLAQKDSLSIEDLYGNELMLIRRGWNSYVDLLRDEIWQNHPQIKIEDFTFYDVSVFNQCENSQRVLMAIGSWKHVHPLLKIIPVDWTFKIPFGLMFSPDPERHVDDFINAVVNVFKNEI